MGLLDLPVELRLQIFELLSDLAPGRHETIGPNVRLTPAICRVSSAIRQETLSLYAKTSCFIIQTDDNLRAANNRVQAWLQALGDDALHEVQSLQLSRHWKLTSPSRWQGHVGFYVRLQIIDDVWRCTTGTYPIANDMRGMRLESADLLGYVARQRLMQLPSADRVRGLSRVDVDFIVDAMDIVASHPVSSFDTEQSEAGRRRRREIWADMEKQLFALSSAAERALGEGATQRRFYTPY